MSKTAFVELQRALGVNYNPESLLADADLMALFSILEVLRTDWMHGEVQHGAFNVEVSAFMRACNEKMEYAGRPMNWEFWRKVRVCFCRF
jgi:hypothetical protein